MRARGPSFHRFSTSLHGKVSPNHPMWKPLQHEIKPNTYTETGPTTGSTPVSEKLSSEMDQVVG